MSLILDLIDHGYSVIPTRGKIPLVEYKQYWEQKVSEDQVKAWWKQYKPCNFAVLCGKFHNLVVVDADTPEAVEWCYDNLHYTPMRVRTRRGLHAYYKHPGFRVKSRRALDEPPVDVKGDGGICTAVGSTHDSGFVYRLDDGADIVAPHDLPIFQKAWFPEAIIPIPVSLVANRSTDNYTRAQRYLDRIPTAGQGARNQQAFKAAAASIRDFGLGFNEGMALMMDWNQHQQPPLPEHELDTIVRSALSNGRYPMGSKLVQ